MYESLPEAWRGWARNFRGAVGSRLSLSVAFAIVVGLFLLPWPMFVASLGSTPAAIAWGSAVALSHLGAWKAWTGLGFGAAASLFYWPGALFLAGILARAITGGRRPAST